MHKLIFLIILLVLQQVVYATNDIKTPSKIKKVVVYRNNAKILRTAKVTVPAGKSEVILEKLTSGLMTNSIQVKIVNAKVELISAVPRINYLEQSKRSERYKIVQDSMKIVQRKLDKLNIQIKALAAKRAVLMNNNPLGSAEKEGFTIEDMSQLMTFKEQKILEIDFKNLEHTYTQQDLNAELTHLRNQLSLLNGAKQKASGEIVLQLQASSATSTDIEVSYVAIGASWSPMYDLRSDGIGKPLELIYKASIYQSTGYDWKDVNLVLSTSNPNQNNDRPLMSPIYIDFQPDYAQKGKQGNKYITYQGSGNVILYNEEDGAPNSLNAPYVNESVVTNSYNAYRGRAAAHTEIETPATTTITTTTDNDNMESILEFELDLKQDIPSDGEQHIIKVKEHDLSVVYEYHSVPKLDKAAFLLAKITDYGQYNLLPGKANIFFEGTFLGQSFINAQVTTDTMLLSLGRDEQINIKREKLQDLTTKKVIGTNTKENITYEIVIRNNKNREIDIDILDQIPISKNENLEVKILEMDKADYYEPYGSLRWKVNIPAGKSKKIKFSYMLKYPKSKNIQMSK